MGAELATVQGVLEQRGDRRVGGARAFELARDLGLATRYDRDVVGPAGDREHERVVCRGVARMQRGDDVSRTLVIAERVERVGDRPGDHLDTRMRKALGTAHRLRRELRTGFDRDQPATPGGCEHELVEQRAEVALAGAAIDDDGLGLACERIVERGLEQANEVANLLELAPRVRVQVSVAGKQVKIL
jgi:hypothetical protein